MALYKYKNGKLVKVAGNYSSKRTLLWTNPSPNVAYAGGTITLSSTDYDYYDIDYKYYINSTYLNTSMVMRTSTLNTILTSANTTGSGALVFKREIWKNENVVTIDAGYSATGNSAGVTENNCLVPIKIYGVRA